MGQQVPDYMMPPKAVEPLPKLDNSGTIALLEQWLREDATDDPAAAAAAECELAEFKAALNANRPSDEPLF